MVSKSREFSITIMNDIREFCVKREKKADEDMHSFRKQINYDFTKEDKTEMFAVSPGN